MRGKVSKVWYGGGEEPRFNTGVLERNLLQISTLAKKTPE